MFLLSVCDNQGQFDGIFYTSATKSNGIVVLSEQAINIHQYPSILRPKARIRVESWVGEDFKLVQTELWNMWNCGSYCRLRNLVSLRWSCWNIWRGEQNPGTFNRFQSISIAFNGSVLFGCGKLWKMVRDEIWDVRFQWCDWFCCTDFNVQYENCLRPWLYPSELLTTMSHTEQVKSLDENSCHKSSQVISLGMESVFFLTAKASCQRLHL